MKIFRSFFKLHQSGILAFVLCSIVFVLIFSLYDLPVGAVLYSAVLSAVICLALFLASFIRYCKRCRMLQKMQQEITVTIQHLPQPQDCKEQAYQELLKRLFQKQQEQAQAWQVRCSDMMEYYTAWTHQMKTPIAAMQLHLQAEHSPENRALLDDLQRIEQYVEMVLHYLQSPTPGWTPSVLTCSSLEGRGLDTIEETLFRFRDSMKESGFWYNRRRNQSLSWVQALVHEALLTAFEQHPAVASRMPVLENMVAGDKMDPVSAAHDLLSHFTYPVPGH